MPSRLENDFRLMQQWYENRHRSKIVVERYYHDPVLYFREVLGMTLWDKQQEIARAILQPPYRVLARSAHSVGKTTVAAGLTSWFFDTRRDGCVITTAPTHRDVCDLLWREIRVQRGRANLGGFVGTSAPELRDSPNHYAKGFTATRGESFQGRHQRDMLFIFDEAVGIDAVFWETTKSMFDPGGRHFWVCLFNPTDTSAQTYAEEQLADRDGNPLWRVVQMSALDHPNIHASLEGKEPPYPAAVSLAQWQDWLASWSEPVAPEDRQPADLEWPPASGRFFRAGPLMESRALGRYPSQATYGVWADLSWENAQQELPDPGYGTLPEVGCDVARFGDDYTCIHVRWGGVSLHHERHNGWDTSRTADRLRELCHQFADKVNRHFAGRPGLVKSEEIPVKIDADGLGVGVVDKREGYRFLPVCGSGSAIRSRDYPNKRSELWFTTANLARQKQISLALLPRDVKSRLRQQCMAPQWKQNSAGQCEVEPKHVTKARLGFSPDDADAFNLAYAAVGLPFGTVGVDGPPAPTVQDRHAEYKEGVSRPERGLFGTQRR